MSNKKLSLQEKLYNIQQELNVPKNLRNEFSNYNYRSAESILTAVKPLLDGAIINLSDEMVMLGNRFYVKSIVSIEKGEEVIHSIGYARESEIKKGMDSSQITGASSSYARKYALNGLFAIDEGNDADTMNNTENRATKKPQAYINKPRLSTEEQRKKIMDLMRDKKVTIEAVRVELNMKKGDKMTLDQAGKAIYWLKSHGEVL